MAEAGVCCALSVHEQLPDGHALSSSPNCYVAGFVPGWLGCAAAVVSQIALSAGHDSDRAVCGAICKHAGMDRFTCRIGCWSLVHLHVYSWFRL